MKSAEVHRALIRACLAFLIGLPTALGASPPHRIASPAAASLWSHDNLFAWTVAPFDAKQRTPEERVEMLARLGFRRYAYSWRERHIPTFDAELDALKKHGIELIGWNMLNHDIDDAPAKASLEAIKRHGLHPRLWVTQSPGYMAGILEEVGKRLPPGVTMPGDPSKIESLPDDQRAAIRAIHQQIVLERWRQTFPKTPEEQAARVKREAERIQAIVKVASAYGCKVALYNHNGWFGMVENQLAIIARLRKMGIDDVGIVYNFSHARDDLHDDTKDFRRLWNRMKDHVVAVNITGTRWEGQIVYPSQGDSELEMMRVIEQSGWKGPVGLIAEKGGDAEITLRNYLTGLDWLAAELMKADSGGERPFPLLPPLVR